jgi:hypothetical protein
MLCEGAESLFPYVDAYRYLNNTLMIYKLEKGQSCVHQYHALILKVFNLTADP